jgi:hypothetical protein
MITKPRAPVFQHLFRRNDTVHQSRTWCSGLYNVRNPLAILRLGAWIVHHFPCADDCSRRWNTILTTKLSSVRLCPTCMCQVWLLSQNKSLGLTPCCWESWSIAFESIPWQEINRPFEIRSWGRLPRSSAEQMFHLVEQFQCLSHRIQVICPSAFRIWIRHTVSSREGHRDDTPRRKVKTVEGDHTFSNFNLIGRGFIRVIVSAMSSPISNASSRDFPGR